MSFSLVGKHVLLNDLHNLAARTREAGGGTFDDLVTEMTKRKGDVTVV